GPAACGSRAARGQSSGCGFPGRSRRLCPACGTRSRGRPRRGSRARRRAPSARSGRRPRSRWGGAGSSLQCLPVLALVVLAVLAGPDRLPPPLVVAVPAHRLLDALVEADRGLPTQGLEPLGGERVAAVVAGTVGDELDQRLIAVRQREDALDDLDVRELFGTADVVDLARLAPLENRVDCCAAVL